MGYKVRIVWSTFLVVYFVAAVSMTQIIQGNAELFSPTRHQPLVGLSSTITRPILDHPETANTENYNPTVKHPPSHPPNVSRGGGGTDVPSIQQLMGIVTFILLEVVFRTIFQAKGIRFPGQLAGCIALFSFMVLVQVLSPGWGDAICNALSPGSILLGKWMGVFFVPGLTMLPLAPSVGSSLEIVKTVGVIVFGFFYSLMIVTYSVLGVRKMMGTISVEATANTTTTANHKPYEASTQQFLIQSAILSGAMSIAATKMMDATVFQKPLETIFFACTTIASYVWAANLPNSITTILNPLLSSALVTMAVARLTGMITGVAFKDVLRSYTCKKLSPLQAGAGDLLLFLLSPSVISFAVGMYKGRTLIAANLPAIVTAVMTGSIGSMFGTAVLARLLQLGGPEGQIIRLATIPRSTQTALGMIIAEMLGGDIAIAATVIILTGIFGGMVGVKTLNAWGVQDSVSRGLGIGSAGLSLGVVSIKGEPQAFAFAGLCLVLTAVAATCLASIPTISDMLIQIAGGVVP